MSNARNLSKFTPSSSGLVETADIADDAVSTDQIANNAVINTSGAVTTTGAFTSVGIDDNADATTITLDANEDITAANGMYVSGDLTSLTVDKGGIDRSGNTTRIISARSGGNYADMSINVAGADLSDGNSGMNRCLYIDYQGNTTIDQGNLVIGTSGKGIDFSANTQSSASGVSNQSELFDYYEEGTWTPVPYGTTTAGSVTSGTTVGRYTRVGNVVYAEYRLSAIVLSSAAGSYYIAGLPYTVGGTAYNGGSAAFHSVTFDGDQKIDANASGTSIYFIVSRSATSWTSLQVGAFGSQHYSHGSVWYTV